MLLLRRTRATLFFFIFIFYFSFYVYFVKQGIRRLRKGLWAPLVGFWANLKGRFLSLRLCRYRLSLRSRRVLRVVRVSNPLFRVWQIGVTCLIIVSSVAEW